MAVAQYKSENQTLVARKNEIDLKSRKALVIEIKELRQRIDEKQRSIINTRSLKALEALTSDIRHLRCKLKAKQDSIRREDGKLPGEVEITLPQSYSNQLKFR